MDFEKHRMGQLEWCQLEHGIRRHSPPAEWRVAGAALHQGRRDPIVCEKPFLQVDVSGNLQRPRSVAAHPECGNHLA